MKSQHEPPGPGHRRSAPTTLTPYKFSPPGPAPERKWPRSAAHLKICLENEQPDLELTNGLQRTESISRVTMSRYYCDLQRLLACRQGGDKRRDRVHRHATLCTLLRY
jgi:hypothetical protein